jgi:hypothetical protein
MSTVRKKLLAWAIACPAVLGLILLAWAAGGGGGGESAVRARQALTAAAMLEAVAAAFAPLLAAGRAGRGSWSRALPAAAAPALWVLAAAAPAGLAAALLVDRGAAASWLMAQLPALGAGLASAGLVLALCRLTRMPELAVAAAGLLLLGFETQPGWTLPVIRAARGRPAAQHLVIDLGVRTSWMGAANAMSTAEPAVWRYDLTSPSLYPPNWVGSDYPAGRPSPPRHMAEYLLFAALLAGLAALRSPAGRPHECTEGNGRPDEPAGSPG